MSLIWHTPPPGTAADHAARREDIAVKTLPRAAGSAGASPRVRRAATCSHGAGRSARTCLMTQRPGGRKGARARVQCMGLGGRPPPPPACCCPRRGKACEASLSRHRQRGSIVPSISTNTGGVAHPSRDFALAADAPVYAGGTFFQQPGCRALSCLLPAPLLPDLSADSKMADAVDGHVQVLHWTMVSALRFLRRIRF